MQCWCRKNDERCTRKAAVTDSIDYFGRCQSKTMKEIFIFYNSFIRSWYLYGI